MEVNNKIGKLHHMAFVSPDCEKLLKTYQDMLGQGTVENLDSVLPETIFRVLNVNGMKYEFFTPTGEKSFMYQYLQDYPKGGIHHICYAVDNIEEATKDLVNKGYTVSGPMGTATNNNKYQFFQPNDFGNIQIELLQC
ncbi:methylmalonyl-coa epimerase [Anaeramoeba flamelloides]|uniref:Methylmalonyl-coa epimerase n=1 Tax=Anaeramoeba flamelloides TaxID=1746091 RepID=A0AAV7ZQQ4_9EUKA|nr:methylmalonyl-coa epimerase [Anaeramoeba flamelloides]KAJ6243954.1 methylmalonyl-coa epimerase [Anaeramoeba flamelloides]